MDGLLIVADVSTALMGLLQGTLVVLEVLVALGLVIFVHELGHFAVAKLVGVKVEKFYLGFDIYGAKLLKFRWGETEYGIGALPLGGYVKMLGQEDNPAKLREEMERAKMTGDGGRGTAEGGDGLAAAVSTAPDDGPVVYDPRSYLAQSVPKRMAIISAGVIMNLIFAVAMATWAYGIGVRQTPAVVGGLMPGEAAWRNDIRVGDRFIEIAGRPSERFQDLHAKISLGDIDQGVPVVIRRPGVKEPIRLTLQPDRTRLAPTIGVQSSHVTVLDSPPALPGSAASRAKPALEPGDKIVRIDDTPVEDYAQLHGYLASHPDKTLKLTVLRRSSGEQPDRKQAADESEQTPAPKKVTIELPPQPMRRLGLVMEMGPITAVQANSPAERAGLRPGDLVRQIDGQPVGDPATLADRLRRRAGQTVTVSVSREGAKPMVELPVTLRQVDQFNPPVLESNPLTAPAIGIAYQVLNRVHRVIPDTPAEKAGLRTGDVVTRAKLIVPADQDSIPPALRRKDFALEFSADKRNWPPLVFAMQVWPPGTQVELQWNRQDKPMQATLEPVTDAEHFSPERGLVLEPAYYMQTASSLGEAVRLGAEKTAESTLMVYQFLRKLGTRQVSPWAIGGPGTIFSFARQAAQQGLSELLMFLTLISANLAVINFLPIPLLDGGHMVLLAYEGVRGKPASERVQSVLAFIGLVFILGLMLWAIGMDIARWIAG